MVFVKGVAGHAPLAAIVLVTVYVPGVDKLRFTAPLLAIFKPPVDVKAPATPPPENTGVRLVAFCHYGFAE